MDMVAVLSKDLEVYCFKKSSIEYLYTHNGEVTVYLTNGLEFHVEYEEIRIGASTISAIKNSNIL